MNKWKFFNKSVTNLPFFNFLFKMFPNYGYFALFKLYKLFITFIKKVQLRNYKLLLVILPAIKITELEDNNELNSDTWYNPHISRFKDFYDDINNPNEFYDNMRDFIFYNNKWKSYNWLQLYQTVHGVEFVENAKLNIIFKRVNTKFLKILNKLDARDYLYDDIWTLPYNYKLIRGEVLRINNLTWFEVLNENGFFNRINIWANNYKYSHENYQDVHNFTTIRTLDNKLYNCEFPNIFNSIFYGCDLSLVHPFNHIKSVLSEVLGQSDYESIKLFISLFYSKDITNNLLDWNNNLMNNFSVNYYNESTEIEDDTFHKYSINYKENKLLQNINNFSSPSNSKSLSLVHRRSYHSSSNKPLTIKHNLLDRLSYVKAFRRVFIQYISNIENHHDIEFIKDVRTLRLTTKDDYLKSIKEFFIDKKLSYKIVITYSSNNDLKLLRLYYYYLLECSNSNIDNRPIKSFYHFIIDLENELVKILINGNYDSDYNIDPVIKSLNKEDFELAKQLFTNDINPNIINLNKSSVFTQQKRSYHLNNRHITNIKTLFNLYINKLIKYFNNEPYAYIIIFILRLVKYIIGLLKCIIVIALIFILYLYVDSILEVTLSMLPLIKHSSKTQNNIDQDEDETSNIIPLTSVRDIVNSVRGRILPIDRLNLYNPRFSKTNEFNPDICRFPISNNQPLKKYEGIERFNMWTNLTIENDFWISVNEYKFWEAKKWGYEWIITYQKLFKKSFLNNSVLSETIEKIAYETDDPNWLDEMKTITMDEASQKWTSDFILWNNKSIDPDSGLAIFEGKYIGKFIKFKSFNNTREYNLPIIIIFNKIFYNWDPEVTNPIQFIKSIFYEILSNSNTLEVASFVNVCYPNIYNDFIEWVSWYSCELGEETPTVKNLMDDLNNNNNEHNINTDSVIEINSNTESEINFGINSDEFNTNNSPNIMESSIFISIISIPLLQNIKSYLIKLIISLQPRINSYRTRKSNINSPFNSLTQRRSYHSGINNRTIENNIKILNNNCPNYNDPKEILLDYKNLQELWKNKENLTWKQINKKTFINKNKYLIINPFEYELKYIIYINKILILHKRLVKEIDNNSSRSKYTKFCIFVKKHTKTIIKLMLLPIIFYIIRWLISTIIGLDLLSLIFGTVHADSPTSTKTRTNSLSETDNKTMYTETDNSSEINNEVKSWYQKLNKYLSGKIRGKGILTFWLWNSFVYKPKVLIYNILYKKQEYDSQKNFKDYVITPEDQQVLLQEFEERSEWFDSDSNSKPILSDDLGYSAPENTLSKISYINYVTNQYHLRNPGSLLTPQNSRLRTLNPIKYPARDLDQSYIEF